LLAKPDVLNSLHCEILPEIRSVKLLKVTHFTHFDRVVLIVHAQHELRANVDPSLVVTSNAIEGPEQLDDTLAHSQACVLCDLASMLTSLAEGKYQMTYRDSFCNLVVVVSCNLWYGDYIFANEFYGCISDLRGAVQQMGLDGSAHVCLAKNTYISSKTHLRIGAAHMS